MVGLGQEDRNDHEMLERIGRDLELASLDVISTEVHGVQVIVQS